ncbi:MAG: c-type cytochrome [Gammaproteobacteria bacterium]
MRVNARRRTARVVVACLCMHLAITGAWGAENETASEPYRVVAGKVDERTYIGWRVYHSVCYGCHGVDATGTSVAPSLVEGVAGMSDRDFATKVLTRYRITMQMGDAAADDTTALREAFVEQVLKHQRGELIMPAWENDPNVKPHVLDLYGYLKARADGALGTGRPMRLR